MPAVDVVVRGCLECGASYEPARAYQKYCSSHCNREVLNRAKTKKRTLIRKAAKAKQQRNCKQCNVRLIPSEYGFKEYCSVKCRKRAGYLRFREREIAERIKNPRHCPVCDELLPPESRPDKKFCSDSCKNTARSGTRMANRRLRVTVKGVPQRIDRVVIYERDGWVCQLCIEPIDRTLRYPDPMSVSLDHVVPVSLGGDNSAENLQASHFRCNLKKGNRKII